MVVQGSEMGMMEDTIVLPPGPAIFCNENRVLAETRFEQSRPSGAVSMAPSGSARARGRGRGRRRGQKARAATGKAKGEGTEEPPAADKLANKNDGGIEKREAEAEDAVDVVDAAENKNEAVYEDGADEDEIEIEDEDEDDTIINDEDEIGHDGEEGNNHEEEDEDEDEDEHEYEYEYEKEAIGELEDGEEGDEDEEEEEEEDEEDDLNNCSADVKGDIQIKESSLRPNGPFRGGTFLEAENFWSRVQVQSARWPVSPSLPPHDSLTNENENGANLSSLSSVCLSPLCRAGRTDGEVHSPNGETPQKKHRHDLASVREMVTKEIWSGLQQGGRDWGEIENIFRASHLLSREKAWFFINNPVQRPFVSTVGYLQDAIYAKSFWPALGKRVKQESKRWLRGLRDIMTARVLFQRGDEKLPLHTEPLSQLTPAVISSYPLGNGTGDEPWKNRGSLETKKGGSRENANDIGSLLVHLASRSRYYRKLLLRPFDTNKQKKKKFKIHYDDEVD